MYYFRFDNSSENVLIQNENGEEKRQSYNAILYTLKYLNDHPELIDEMQERVIHRIRTGKRTKQFPKYLESLLELRSKDMFWEMLVDNLDNFAEYHNQKAASMVHLPQRKGEMWPGKYSALFPDKFEQLRQVLKLCSGLKMDCQLERRIEGMPVRCTVEAGKLFYSLDASELGLPAFIFLFLSAMQYAELMPRRCNVCGTLFCGKSSDMSCSKSECKKLVVLDSDQSRKEERKKILNKYQDKIRQDRYQLRQMGCPAAVIEEFKATVAKQQEAIVRDKLTELELTDASVFEIIKTQRWVKENCYQIVNQELEKIIKEYCLS